MKEGWEYKSLDKICTIVGRIGFRGYTKSDLVADSSLGAITLSPSNIIDGELSYSRCTYIRWEKYEESPEIQLSEGDVVLVKTASIGKCAVVRNLPHKATLNPQFVVFKNLLINSEFITYYLRCKKTQDSLLKMAGGVAIPTLSQKKLGSLQIPVPPHSEQQRIVEYLDSAFAKIDALKAKAKENLDNAQALFQAALKEMMTPKEGWEEKTLGEVGSFKRGGNFSKKDFVDSGFPCLHYGQIHMKLGTVTNTHLSSVPEEMVKPERCAHKGDLVIAITSEDDAGSCKCTAWMGDYNIYVGGHTAIYTHTLNAIYMSYYFQSPTFQKEKLQYTHGFKVVEISPKNIAKISIAYPNESEQLSIVNKLDKIKEKLTTMQQNYNSIIQNCDVLKQALLRQVFE